MRYMISTLLLLTLCFAMFACSNNHEKEMEVLAHFDKEISRYINKGIPTTTPSHKVGLAYAPKILSTKDYSDNRNNYGYLLEYDSFDNLCGILQRDEYAFLQNKYDSLCRNWYEIMKYWIETLPDTDTALLVALNDPEFIDYRRQSRPGNPQQYLGRGKVLEGWEPILNCSDLKPYEDTDLDSLTDDFWTLWNLCERQKKLGDIVTNLLSMSYWIPNDSEKWDFQDWLEENQED